MPFSFKILLLSLMLPLGIKVSIIIFGPEPVSAIKVIMIGIDP